MQRSEMIDAISERSTLWDVIVIGGGATGLGAALEAASRGHRTVLVEASDFAKGTSSRSTKLIHGGVRYLRQGQIRMVRESLLERKRLLHNAPHIVHPLGFVLPTYRWGADWYYYAGLKAYDMLGGSSEFPGVRRLSKQETLASLSTLKAERLQGGVLYFDGQFDDTRLAISLLRTLVNQGGTALNYAPVTRLIQEGGRTAGVTIRDQESGREFLIRGRAILNATGVFVEEISRMDSSAAQGESLVTPSQGSHLVLDTSFLPSERAMMIPETDDGRVLFAIPWHGKLLFGTTDLAVDQIEIEPRPLKQEVDYLLEHAGRYLTRTPRREDILSTFAGLRPLFKSRSAGDKTASLSREHEIRVSSNGLISIIGGKWTTYRLMGENLIHRAEQVGALPRKSSRTATLKLQGAADGMTVRGESSKSELDPFTIYGSDQKFLESLIEKDPESAEKLHPRLPYRGVQVVWGVRQEMARTVEDILARRTRALFLDARAAIEAAPTVAQLMRRELGQSDAWESEQIQQFESLAKGYLL